LKILVTGGAGFIGRHLVKTLIEERHHVVVFDNLSNSSKKMLSFISGEFSFVKGDITNYDQISSVVSGVDFVVHLAAEISVRDSINNSQTTKWVNVEGTENLLKACVKSNVKNFIATSSASVYGNWQTTEISLNEESKTKPTSPYGESKLEMENQIRQFSIKNDINSIILRLFNVYGEGQSNAYAGVISKFAKNIRKDETLIIFGDGRQTRDFVSIKDVVDSIKQAMTKISGKRGVVYNIGSGKSITIQDLAKLMISVSGKMLDIKNVEPKKGDVRFSKASIKLAKSELCFDPKINLKNEIKELLKMES